MQRTVIVRRRIGRSLPLAGRLVSLSRQLPNTGTEKTSVSLRPIRTISSLLPNNTIRTMATAPEKRQLDPSVFSQNLLREVLDFWFQGIPESTTVPEFSQAKRWFGMHSEPGAKEEFDARSKSIAGAALDELSPERYPLPTFISFDADREHAAELSAPFRARIVELAGSRSASASEGALPLSHATLAMVLLLDQFPRNTLRDRAGQAVVYTHYDRLARGVMHYICDDANSNDPLYQIDRDPAIKAKWARRMFFYLPFEHSEDLRDHDLKDQSSADVLENATPEMAQFIKMGDDFSHRPLLEQFGRYPHRNHALGRETTAEERRYLDQGGHTFGTSQE